MQVHTLVHFLHDHLDSLTLGHYQDFQWLHYAVETATNGIQSMLARDFPAVWSLLLSVHVPLRGNRFSRISIDTNDSYKETHRLWGNVARREMQALVIGTMHKQD
jgi:hypothetical protein